MLIGLTHPLYLLLGEGDFWWMLPITITTGFAAGGFQALPNSMKADVIDIDTLNSGENRSALFFSTWSFTSKMTASIGSWLALSALAWVGFNTAPEAYNESSQLFGLRLIFSSMSSIFYFLAILVIWKYPITEETHSKVREILDKRNTEKEA